MTKYSYILGIFLCTLFGFGQELLVVDYSDMSLEDLLNMEIVTASKVAQKSGDAPATVRVITDEQIARMGFRDLKDIFRTLPGFDVSYDVQGEVRTLVIGRGILGNQKLSILQDGLRYSPTTGERFIYGNNMPLNHVKRVEIVYGSASALYGADAFSGVVNIITKKGEDYNGLQANVGYLDTGALTADVAYGKKWDNGWDVTAFFRMVDGTDFPLHEEYDDYSVVDSYQGTLGSLSNDYLIDNWNLFFKAQKGDWSFGFDHQHELETNAPSTIPTQYAYVEENVWGQNLSHAFLKHEKQLTEQFQLSTTVSFSEYEVNSDSNFYIVQDTDLSEGLPSYKYAQSESLKIESQGMWSLENGSVIAGIFYEDVKSFPKTKNLDGVPFDTSGPLEDDLSSFVDANGYTFGLLGLTESIFGTRNYDNWGGYLQGAFNPTEKMALTLGVRYDDNSIYGSTVNPRVGLVVKATESFTSKIAFGTAYIQPSNYYRWENWANPFAMHIPNQDIQPETVDSYTLTGIYRTGNQSIQVDLFYNDLKDVITPVPAPAQEGGYPYYNPLRTIIGEDPSTGFVEINANQGEIQTYGMEIEYFVKAGQFLGSASYTFLDGDDNDQSLAKTSKNKILVNLEYDHSAWDVGATIRHTSDINTSIYNSEYGTGGNGDLKFDGSTILFANVGYTFSNSIKINLAVDNLLDESYYGASPYGESVWITSKAPQAGRKIWINVRVNM